MVSQDETLAALRAIAQAGRDIPSDWLSGQATHALAIEPAVQAAGFARTHDRLMAAMRDGAIDWRRFDIAEFVDIMPSLAYLDRVETDAGADFRYRFVGEGINAVARRPLRGLLLSEVLTGTAARQIIAEYERVITDRAPRASAGRVVVSDMSWISYLRLLYPVRTGERIDRLLLVMLFATDKNAWGAGPPR
ncbi:hypothetical protein KAJ83_00615 [Marivibrio halodurans]|uniref:PAS domain-containing protein n=1 Tax=Marivibrio halodurans TaxID=2039722 RepID=A0A8J7V0N4_9PROT|nr:hypothetical protein [Marivibrio halodurans]MBP5855495.1 hypothetical protein [Marivibrio halodurans]